MKHYKAGTRVEKLRSLNGSYSYAAKSYAGKELQFGPEKPSRFWGVFGRFKGRLGERQLYKIDPDQAFDLRRMFRNYRLSARRGDQWKKLRGSVWSEAEFQVCVFCDVDFWLQRLKEFIQGG